MKNTLKRILLFLPVISVLLVALAVPVFADWERGTGWDPIVGSVDVPNGVAVALPSFSVTPLDIAAGDYCLDIYSGTWDTSFIVPTSETKLGYFSVFFEDTNLIADLSESYPVQYDYYEFYGMDFDGALVVDIGGGQKFDIENALGPWLQDAISSGLLTSKDQLVLRIYLYEYPPEWTFSVEPAYFFSDAYVVENLSPSDSVTSVWTEIMTWITFAFNTVMGAFYVDGSLTLLGTLACIGVSVGIGFLLIGLIQRFLHLRG